MPLASTCGVLDAIASVEYSTMAALNRKIRAMRRLADLLENLGDLTIFFPDITKLIPLSQIDTTIYDDLQSACPFLNLPPSEGASNAVGQLQARVNGAYGNLIGQLNNLPWKRMGQLQNQIDRLQTKLLGGQQVVSEFIQCAQQACATANAVGESVSSLVSATSDNVSAETADFIRNYVDDNGQVLNAAQQEKLRQVDETIQGVSDLVDIDTSVLPIPDPIVSATTSV